MTKSFDDELVHKTVLELFNMVKSKQAEIDELQKRVNEHNRKLNIFIDELKKTHNDDKDNKIDYWRGFSECADSSVQVFLRDVGFID